jgi:hypothetical protein
LVRALDCHSRGRGFEPRRPRWICEFGVSESVSECDALIDACTKYNALVVKLVDTPS